jgi:large subunit ribosomal protein L18
MSKSTLYERRRRRVRNQLNKRANDRPRLSVFRSSKHIYAQLIDDVAGHTITSASSLEKDVLSDVKTGANKDAASKVGELMAKRAIDAGITEVVFDRGGYKYHGRVKALGESAREGGLSF